MSILTAVTSSTTSSPTPSLIDKEGNSTVFESKDRLYALTREPSIDQVTTLSATLSKKERDVADLVKEYQRRMGHISVEQLAQISRDGNLHLPFSTEDI
jgi:PHP family Zn ribbon phosphoesterase